MAESEFRQQLEILKNEKRQLIKELKEFKEKYDQLKSERDGLARAEDQWKLEKAMLLKKIEMVV